MLFISLMIFVAMAPYIWFTWAYADYKRGVKETLNWKGPLILLIVSIVLVLILNIYYAMKYGIPIFVNTMSGVIGLIVSGTLVIIMALINIIITFTNRKKPLPKSIHNPKLGWGITGVLFVAMMMLFLWFAPAGEKIRYVDNLNRAVEAMEDSNEEVALSLVYSEDQCLRIRRCEQTYGNVFYVKNNLDETKEVQVRIRALNENKEELKVIESKVMTVKPGEVKLVESEETMDFDDNWGKLTFETEEQVVFYQHEYRYREPSN